MSSELENQGTSRPRVNSARYVEQIQNMLSDVKQRDFSLLELTATFVCFPFDGTAEADVLALKTALLFHMDPSALEDEILTLQTDIHSKSRASAGQF